MAFVKSDIEQKVLDMISKLKDLENQDDAEKIYASEIADILEYMVQNIDVIGVSTGVSTTVVTAGSATAQTGTGTGSGTQNNKGSLQ